jgi:septum formation protein
MNLAYPLILGSKSPRRKEILEKAGFEFKVESLDTEENYGEDLPKNEVAAYLAEVKAKAFLAKPVYHNKLILTADTTVLLDNQLLEKPADASDARRMLRLLSGRYHEVISAFSILLNEEIKTFTDTTKVLFAALTEEEISNYISLHQPYDKAGAYGIQEGIGLTHIHELMGSYFTVMGLPIHKVYEEMARFRK